MTEMELFVDIIDDKEANSILEYFRETPNGSRKANATLVLKKNQIKRIFKSMTPNMKRKRIKGGADPFYAYIRKYLKVVPEKGRTFEEHLNIVLHLNSKTPQYALFANLLLTFPQETRDNLDRLSKLFDQSTNTINFKKHGFESIDELVNFLRNFGLYSGEKGLENIIKKLSPFIESDYTLKIEECKKTILNYNLLDFYNEKENLYNQYGLVAANSAYILLNREHVPNDILQLMAVEMIFYVLNNQKLNIHSEDKDKSKTHQNMIEEFQRKIGERENSIQEYKMKIKKITRDNKNNKVEINNLLKGISELSEENKTNIQLLENKERTIENLKSHISKLEKAEEIRNIHNTEKNNIFASGCAVESDWMIIFQSDMNIIKEIFPEVLVLYVDDKDNIMFNLSRDSITNVFLVMNGLSTKRFRGVEKLVNNYSKKLTPIDFENMKEAIEWIGYKKTIDRKGVMV